MTLFTGESPKDIKGIPQYLNEVLTRISAILSRPKCEYMDLKVHYSEPKIAEGRVVIADGTSWNPGSGVGLYRYETGTGWVKVG